ncbi:MAG: BTAD domain-containing putative transcriptional regulator [Meiothermus sp.]|nr:BTAD domain-containing putative transcriptional regulator [Meiothermus sp.]
MQLHLLGQPRLVVLGQEHPVLGYGALVLAWLALHGRADGLPTRVRLARALWPDEDDDQARRRLTNTLFRLKRDFPQLEPHLVGDARTLGLKHLSLDTARFGQQIQSTDPQHWLAALEMYRGDLLEDSDVAWLEEWRTELRELFLRGLHKAFDHFAGINDAPTALRLAQRWVAADPLSEEAHTALIRLYAAQNRTADALAQYEALKQTLERELNLMPRRETQAFVHSLRPSDQSYRSLVGRTKELRAFADRLEELRAGQGGIMLLEGEPGLGKTRLLEEAAQLARWHRLAVLRGAASEQHETPYAPLDAAMREAGLLLEVASPLMRETLRPLLEAAPDRALSSSSSAVGAALERWLLKLDEPVVLLLDDLQWAGDLFWALLPVLARLARQQQLLLVLAHRSQELHGEPFALEALSNLQREGSVLHLELSGLSLEECETLAKSLGKTLDKNQLEHLYRLSSGNPLVLGELLRGSGSAEHLEGLLRQRFERLDERSRQALEAASVLGNAFDGAVWAAMLDFVPPVQKLLEARLLHQEDTKLCFQHDLIRSLIYQGMGSERRQTWHGKALKALSNGTEPSATLALHAREAGMLEACTTLYLRAAREALSHDSLPQADRYLEQAQQHLPDSAQASAEALQLRLLQQHLRYTRNPSSEVLDQLDELEAAARRAGLDELVFDAHLLRLKAITAKGDVSGYRTAAESALAEAKNSGNLEHEVQMLNTIALTLAGRFVDPVSALPLAERAQLLASSYGLASRLRFGALNALMTCYGRQKNLSALEQSLNQAETLFNQHPELAGFELSLHSNRGLLYLFQDRYEEAAEAFKRQIEASRIVGNTVSLSLALQNLTLVQKMTGQYREALAWAEEMADLAQVRQGQLDPNRTAYYLSTLAELLAFLERPAEAEALMQPVMAAVEGQGKGDGEVKARTVMAVVRRAQSRYLEGYGYLLTNIQVFANNPANQVLLQVFAAEMAWFAGLPAEARALLAQATPHKAALGRAFGLIWWHYVRFLVEGQATDLEAARLVTLAFAANFKDAQHRQDFLQSHYPKAVLELWKQQTVETATVELTSADGSSKIPLVWTLDSEASDKQHFSQDGKVGLRQHRLRRLVLEAAAQGAVPMQSELAEVLGVSVRTLEADLAALRGQGIELKTLGMRREAVR